MVLLTMLGSMAHFGLQGIVIKSGKLAVCLHFTLFTVLPVFFPHDMSKAEPLIFSVVLRAAINTSVSVWHSGPGTRAPVGCLQRGLRRGCLPVPGAWAGYHRHRCKSSTNNFLFLHFISEIIMGGGGDRVDLGQGGGGVFGAEGGWKVEVIVIVDGGGHGLRSNILLWSVSVRLIVA